MNANRMERVRGEQWKGSGSGRRGVNHNAMDCKIIEWFLVPMLLSLSLSKFLRLFMDCIFHVRSSQEKNKKNDTPLSINRFLSLNSYDFSWRTLLYCQKRSNRNPLTFRSGAHFFLPIIYSRGPRHWDYLSNSMSKIFWHISIFLSWIVCFSHACLSLEK